RGHADSPDATGERSAEGTRQRPGFASLPPPRPQRPHPAPAGLARPGRRGFYAELGAEFGDPGAGRASPLWRRDQGTRAPRIGSGATPAGPKSLQAAPHARRRDVAPPPTPQGTEVPRKAGV